MSIVVREARVGDAAAIVEFMRAAGDEPDNNLVVEPGEFSRTAEEQIKITEEAAASDNSVLLVAEDEGRIVGLLGLHGGNRWASKHSAGLGMTIHKERRGEGIGTRLLQSAIEWAKGTGVVTRIWLEVYPHNAPAIHIYEKCGFVREGVKRNAYIKSGKSRDVIMMALLLDADKGESYEDRA